MIPLGTASPGIGRSSATCRLQIVPRGIHFICLISIQDLRVSS